MANIILFEANNGSDNGSNLFIAAQTAANTPGVVAVSMSWTFNESSYTASQISTYDSTVFTTPSGHVGGSATLGGTGLPGGVTFLAAAGDNGPYAGDGTYTIAPQYPATSPNVIAVGGTSLTVDGSNPNYTYGGETAWGNGVQSAVDDGGGGGISAYESQPSYQSGVVSAFSTTQRTYPDVSADADPNTGVPVYDSYDDGTLTPWNNYNGGTSLSTPVWTGIIAIADEGRAIAGQGSLNGRTQTLPALYKLPAADFNDITVGSTGPAPTYSAGPGYDLATGIGSPVSNLLIPGLVAYGVTPSFTLTGPTSGTFTAGQTVTIQWTAADVDAGSSISLAYDTTTNWGNPKWIEIGARLRPTARVPIAGTPPALPRGPTIWPVTWDDKGVGYLSHLTSAITITAGTTPSFTLTGPTSGSFTAGQTVTIQWTAANVDAGSSVSLAYDTTTNWGNPKWIEIDAVSAADGSGIL